MQVGVLGTGAANGAGACDGLQPSSPRQPLPSEGQPKRTALEQAARCSQHLVGLPAAALAHHLQQAPPHASICVVVGAQAPRVGCKQEAGRCSGSGG